ncbi:acyl-CoA thioester hydrolase/BAAT C-terminal domain-containing protein [Providencia rustigianii]|uniref:BAAT/Acyl-CoA thioester hydrolase C-terminal domain-containing protein n=6 Tax=Providencia rustigianii TaxID=158850 RepID=D1NYU8_9GAMM|nr:acyl-CoA thioester hydrolase/BAAT C-terminal domain-containing protein [Providencia rustigianii]EFB73646.1 hypothetical protein PROVRUST_04918 [Providencia rustigianii DSM 4541]SPY77572.1 Uncharacterised protein [Providencia rustigianii]SUC27027.1 Uncharacterised protein [Providencia rustigianii]SUC35560.1 Uncharacterised protein [Providencia rustigianii]
MKKIIFIAMCVFSYPVTTLSETTNYEKQVLKSGEKEIHYYLLKNTSKKTENLLVLIQGSDCKSILNNQNIMANFSQILPNSDILLVEKTGLTPQTGKENESALTEDCPIVYMQNDSYYERVDNYITVLNEIKKDYKNIVLLGGSEGAIVTNIIASKIDFIDASISLNGGGQYFIDDVIYSIKNSVPSEEVEASTEGFKQFANAVLQNQLEDDQFPSNHGKNWWYEALTIDNKKLLESVNKPHLVIQTLADINVDVESSEKMMNDIANPNITYKTYPTLDHYFKDSSGNNHTSVIVNDIQHWYTTIKVK